MKKILLITTVFVLCLSLCSCDSLLKEVKSAMTGEEVSQMPEDYITTLKNSQFEYEIYDDYVKIISYLAEETAVIIPETIDDKPVRVIGSLCFHQTDADVTSVKIPKTVKIIESSAFYYADSLKAITIPDTVTSLGSRAFAWCKSLETVSIGSGINEIPEYCFNSCISLATVEIPVQITKIGLRAFSYCDLLNDQVIPVNIESIGDRAFVGCQALEYITFENSNIKLGAAIFEESENVIVIAEVDSVPMSYCEEYNLRWSTSKDVEAIILGGETSDDVSEVVSE